MWWHGPVSIRDMLRDPLVSPVVLVAHDPSWHAAFLRERRLLLRALGDAAVDVEHIGSTAIPGMMAKPRLDLMLGLRDLALMQLCNSRFARLGYLPQAWN